MNATRDGILRAIAARDAVYPPSLRMTRVAIMRASQTP